MQGSKESSLRKYGNYADARGKRGLTHKDVKNEGTSGDVYENTGCNDKMYTQGTALLQRNVPIEQ
jgi:hypothetical protein